jgi:hypothetical protein
LLIPFFLFATGCRTAKPLPQFNLSEPGWKVRNGQAVWHVPQGKTEVAGDLVVATNPQGDTFVQFSKSPFPLVIARATPKQWHVEFPPQNKNYSGRGKPPLRLIWLWLPRILSGEPPPKNWKWHSDESGFRLENPSNDESVQGFFNQ